MHWPESGRDAGSLFMGPEDPRSETSTSGWSLWGMKVSSFKKYLHQSRMLAQIASQVAGVSLFEALIRPNGVVLGLA